MGVLDKPKIHSYLKSDKYGFTLLAWDISTPLSSASLYVNRKRDGKEPTKSKELLSPSTLPPSASVKLILPLRGQGPVKVSSSGVVTVEDIMRTIYDHYHQKIDIRNIRNIPPRRKAEINSAFKMRCDAALRVGGPELEKEVTERGICEVDRLDGKVEFESLTFSAEDDAWELHLVRPLAQE